MAYQNIIVEISVYLKEVLIFCSNTVLTLLLHIIL